MVDIQRELEIDGAAGGRHAAQEVLCPNDSRGALRAGRTKRGTFVFYRQTSNSGDHNAWSYVRRSTDQEADELYRLELADRITYQRGPGESFLMYLRQ